MGHLSAGRTIAIHIREIYSRSNLRVAYALGDNIVNEIYLEWTLNVQAHPSRRPFSASTTRLVKISKIQNAYDMTVPSSSSSTFSCRLSWVSWFYMTCIASFHISLSPLLMLEDDHCVCLSTSVASILVPVGIGTRRLRSTSLSRDDNLVDAQHSPSSICGQLDSPALADHQVENLLLYCIQHAICGL